ncbi:asparagine--tRNA ligase [Spiroplasma tabanidicola]|uniref:Asparagine--tRNA ligase n=1 Tax=Spiroplasma tabanidicola TaxID=324079 RepID=A0A6I6CBI5_9MOLU|nr:asparagine--tRNA ligase [Spiroplasma tabanidicola]QGS51548.1 asparaginyl-tRNA synthetase [Spiroplasma tabanidicola]
MDLKDLFLNYQKHESQNVTFLGRVRSHRQGKAVSFLVLNDGTSLNDVQVVYKSEVEGFDKIKDARVSSIVEVYGEVIVTPRKPQPFEIQAKKLVLLDQAVEEYPLQKKEHSPEFLREIAHLRARTKTFQSIFRLRSSLAYAIHKFFQEQNYVYVNAPIITGNDAEGAGEAFVVTTREDGNYEEDFFGKKASLSVSGQLHGESYAQAFNKIYTFGPTFRAEDSNTSRHAAEFWMIEPEIAFIDLQKNLEIIESMVKFVINYVMENNLDELKFCEKNLEFGLIEKLTKVRDAKFQVCTYEEVINTLKIAVDEGHVFENNDIKFGTDLGSEHEKYICEVVYKGPTFIINYPKDIKAFYMKQNDDNKTVAASDLIVPGIGELVGGSQREDDFEKLIRRCKDMGVNIEELDWYNNLRKYGYYKSAGFGLGFERLVMYITGASNIRDVISFPRTPNNLLF